jgi:hypothetical protein
MSNVHRTGPVDIITVAVPLTSNVPTNSIAMGTPVALVAGSPIPAVAFTWTTDLATTQTNFAAAFFGISESRSIAGSTDVRNNQVAINMDGTYEFDVTTGTDFAVGQFIGCSKGVGNNLIDTVEVVPTKARAIAVVVEDTAAGALKVRARLVNTLFKR